jgi:hypothetical protein
VAILDGAHKGETFPDALIYPKGLQSQTRPLVGQKVLGRVTQGNAKPGQAPPWLLATATAEDVKVAEAYVANGSAEPDPAGEPPF